MTCPHCGLPVPAGLADAVADLAFCCSGCRTAYALIQGAGLSRYYELRRDVDDRPERARGTGKAYSDFDDPAFTELYCRLESPDLMRVELYVEGVHCSACVWLIEKAILQLDGVLEATLDVSRSLVRIGWNPNRMGLSEVARRLDALGYPTHPPRGARSFDARRREDRALLARLAVAGAIAGNVMLMAFALYGGHFSGMDAQFAALFRWGSLLLALPSVAWAAQPFYRGAWAALRTRTPHMDLPVSVGILAGFGWGVLNAARDRGDIYFDSIATLIFLLLVGRLIQRRQQHAAWDAAELLYSLAPASARLVENGAARDVPIQALELGALVEVRAGERVPVDGIVVGGCSAIDASLLTGESHPADVGVGDSISAGTINLSGRLLVRVEQTGESTRVGRLLERMREARRRRAPVVVLADRVAGRFVVVALALAALTLAIWLALDPEHAVDHAVALLVVTCPCALGMATPLAVTVALGRAARSGILIKGGDTLEASTRLGLIVFDKTGTLTEGKLRLLCWQGPEASKELVRSVESDCAHPIARAFMRAFEDVAPIAAQNVEHALGGGVCGDVAGRRVVVGAPGYVARLGVTLDEPMLSAIEQQTSLGRTPVVVAVDGRAKALAAFGDPVRRDAAQSLRRLRDLGYELAILSGDHPRVVAAVAAELGVPFAGVVGGATPEAKLEFIQQRAARGTVLMVGDGVNDAAALSAATVGIAVHGGAEASLDAADVFLTQGGLSPVVTLLDCARRTLAVIRRSIGFSLAYNVVGVTLAMSGVLSPLIAALMMPLSSLSVLASSLLSRTFPKPAAPASEEGPRLSVAEVRP